MPPMTIIITIIIKIDEFIIKQTQKKTTWIFVSVQVNKDVCVFVHVQASFIFVIYFIFFNID